MTHTARLVVTERMTGQASIREVQVRVLPTRIVDEQGRTYDRHMHGNQVGPTRNARMGSYHRRIDLGSLRAITRERVRL